MSGERYADGFFVSSEFRERAEGPGRESGVSLSDTADADGDREGGSREAAVLAHMFVAAFSISFFETRTNKKRSCVLGTVPVASRNHGPGGRPGPRTHRLRFALSSMLSKCAIHYDTCGSKGPCLLQYQCMASLRGGGGGPLGLPLALLRAGGLTLWRCCAGRRRLLVEARREGLS